MEPSGFPPLSVRNRESCTGLMTSSVEYIRFENFVTPYIQKGGLEYMPKWGLDWNLVKNPKIKLSADTINTYISQECASASILIASVKTVTSEITSTSDVVLMPIVVEKSQKFGVV